MNSPRAYVVVATAGLTMLVFAGCTTKNYVRQQTQPLVDHVNTLDQETAANANQLRNVKAQTQKGLMAANQSSQQAMTAAQGAQERAAAASSQLNQTSNQVQTLDNTVANLDNYQPSSTASVHFGFNRWNLTARARRDLANVVQQLQQNPHSILEVQGYTDAIGSKRYNDILSQRRADTVVQYLESRGVAPHRVFMVGLGKNQFVASNRTPRGRAQNRRVDLRILVNSLGASASPAGAGAQPAASSGGEQPQAPQQ